MHATTAKLLRAASEIVGGDKALAERLGIVDAQLAGLMSGQHEMPERVLLRTVDIILANHGSQHSLPRRRTAQATFESTRDD